jgi:hypothetical protein
MFNKKFLVIPIAMSLTLLTSCEAKDIITDYYTSGTRDDYEYAVQECNSVFKGIVEDIPMYYQKYYKVNIEIVDIVESKQSEKLTSYLVVAKYITEDNNVGYTYDEWKVNDKNELVDMKNIWTDVI